jgi:hypothetical protein
MTVAVQAENDTMTVAVQAKYALRVLVSSAKDAAQHAKSCWFPHVDCSLVLELDKSDGHMEEYLTVFRRATGYFEKSKCPVLDVIKTFANGPGQKLVVLLNPPNGQDMSAAVHACRENGLWVLCHFTKVNQCFTPLLPEFINDYTYDSGPDGLFGKRYFVIANTRMSSGPIFDKRGVFVINSYVGQDVEKFVARNFMNYDPFRMGDMSAAPRFYPGSSVMFVRKESDPFLGRFLIYDPGKCPKMLIPGCMHVFVDMHPAAVRKLCARVFSNDALQKGSLFLCIAKRELQDWSSIFADNHCGSSAPIVDQAQSVRVGEDKVSDDLKRNKKNQAFQLSDDVVLPDEVIRAHKVSVVLPEPPKDASVPKDDASRVLFTVKERPIVLEKETVLRFHNLELLPKGHRLVLKTGFPAEAQYALAVNDKHVCDSVEECGEAVFVLPDECGPGWMHVTMKDETEERHLCWNGEFYFPKYEISGLRRSFLITPRATYKARVSDNTLLLKTCVNNAFGLVETAYPFQSVLSSPMTTAGNTIHTLQLADVACIVKKCDDPKPERPVLVLFQKDSNKCFYPKKMEMIEVYIERP